jgi:hypothetical protein
MSGEHSEEEVLSYGDPFIATKHARVPVWLLSIYLVIHIWGIFWLIFFWNGSEVRALDPGYWNQLQRAANTTVPYKNLNSK